MPYCSQCGVEVVQGIERCPLCGAPVQDFGNGVPPEKEYPDHELDAKPRMSERSKRNLAWQVVSILCGIAVIVVAASDLRAHGTIGWSRYPIGAVALAWLISTVGIYLRRRPLLVLVPSFAASVAFLAFLSLASGGFEWFLALALPLLFLVMVTTALCAFAITRLRSFGLNVVALVGLGLAVLSAGVDGAIEHFLSGRIALSWSIIVLQALVPFSGIMFFLHYRLRNRFDFKRIFHL